MESTPSAVRSQYRFDNSWVQACERLAAIEASTDPGTIRHLERALNDLDRKWRTEPHGEAARTLLARHEAEVRVALEYYDRLADTVQRADRPWCLTHGEPNGANLVQDSTGAPHSGLG